MLMRRTTGMVLAAALCAGACATEPQEAREIAWIAGFHEDDPWIEMPDTVGIGSSFPIRIITFGDGCYRAGETEAEWSGPTVTITPYNYVDLTQAVCDRILLYLRHSIAVMPEHTREPGEITVRLRGIERPNYDDVIVVERTIRVRDRIGDG